MLFTVPPQIALGLGVALLLKDKSPTQPLFRALYYLPVITSWVVVSLLFRYLFADKGLINWALGLHVSWLSDRWTALVAICVLGVWKGIGWSMMIFLAALQGVPQSLVEAAKIDGAGPWMRFRTVTLPAIWPTMTFVTIMLVIGGLNVFTSVQNMTGGAPGGDTDVVLTYMYRQAFEFLDFGYGSAIAVLLTLLVFHPLGHPAVLLPQRRAGMRTPANALRVTTLAIGALVMVTPFLYMLSTSFKAQQYVLKVPPQFIPDPATLSNYERVLVKGNFVHFFLNSLLVAGSSTFIAVFLSAMMAYGFARYRFPAREWLFRLLLLGLMIPAMMLIIPQFILAKWLG